MLSGVLAHIGLPMLVKWLGKALEPVDNSAAQHASNALSALEQAISAGQITDIQLREAHRHAEAMAALDSEAHKVALSEINASLRAEVASNDPYVRRMRPTFGYLMAITWAAQMLGLAYVMVFDTARAGEILNGMSSLSAIWAVRLSVLGIYVYKRSEEKRQAV